jgi:hypothetical protein
MSVFRGTIIEINKCLTSTLKSTRQDYSELYCLFDVDDTSITYATGNERERQTRNRDKRKKNERRKEIKQKQDGNN